MQSMSYETSWPMLDKQSWAINVLASKSASRSRICDDIVFPFNLSTEREKPSLFTLWGISQSLLGFQINSKIIVKLKNSTQPWDHGYLQNQVGF